MATESNTGFHYEDVLGSTLNPHAISFQPGAINSTSEMLGVGDYFGMNGNSMMFSGNSNMINSNPVISQAGNSSGSLLLDSVPGLKHDAGLAVEWSVEEQYKLEEGLAKYADEPSIMRYIKIAATLRDKTVRDVALRCRWMMRKRRKPEDHNVGKKVNNRKDKLVDSSSKINIPPILLQNTAAYPIMINNMNQSDCCMPFEGVSGPARHFLEQNKQAFSQIRTNFSTYKLQDNIELFRCARNNLTAILNEMRDVPMPALPVSIDEDLASSIFPNTT